MPSRHFVATLPAIFVLVLAVACTGTPPAAPQPDLTLADAYQQWGEKLYSERSSEVRWEDGSNWTDGVSHLPPPLPIGRDEYIGPDFTCAQAELLEMTAFPEEYDISTWASHRDSGIIGEQWRQNHATLVWGGHPWALDVYEGVSFSDQCGSRMRAEPVSQPADTPDPAPSPTPRPTYTPYPASAASASDSTRPPIASSPEVTEVREEELFWGVAWLALERGIELQEAGKHDAAIKSFRRAQQHHNKPSGVLDNRLAVSYHSLGLYDLAIRYHSSSIALDNSAIDWVGRARSYLETGQCGLAVEDAKTALALASESAPSYHTDVEANIVLYLCYFTDDNMAAALQHVDAAISLAEEHSYPPGEIAGMSQARDQILSN